MKDEKPLTFRQVAELVTIIVFTVGASVGAVAALAQDKAPTEEDFRGALAALTQQRDFAQGQHAAALADLLRANRRITELEAKVKASEQPKPEPAKKAP